MGKKTTPSGFDALPPGVEIREGSRGNSIRITFSFNGQRHRETLDIPVSAANINYASRLRGEVLNAIQRGNFNYAQFFPESKIAKEHKKKNIRYKFGYLIDQYLDRLRDTGSVSPSTLASYVKYCKARILPKWGNVYVDTIGTRDIRDWIISISKDMAPKSVRNCLVPFSVVMSEAAMDKIIPENPMKNISLRVILPRRRANATLVREIDPFNTEEIASILAAALERAEWAAILFAFSTGVRPGELFALKWHNIDWKEGTVHIVDNVVSAEVGTVEKGPKSERSREVPMIPTVRQALEAMRPISQARSAYVFLNPRTGRRWHDEQQWRIRWTAILELAGVRYRNPYQTRHTFASTLLMNGEPELLVAKLLGHATVEMVRRNYGKYLKPCEGPILRGIYTELGGKKP